MLKIVPLFYIVVVAFALELGFSRNYYKKGDKVELLVNKVESDHTQLPYGYYDLPFICPASNEVKSTVLSLGEILKGDRSRGSDYKLKFGEDIQCQRLCDMNVRPSGVSKAEYLIKNGYVVHWSLDGLPGATTFESDNHNNKFYAAGFPLGFYKDEVSYIYNHVMLVIRYHQDKQTGLNSIVGFEVYPKSVSDASCPGSSKRYKNMPLIVKKDSKEMTLIQYTYSVYWREDNSIEYDSRWDLYYENEHPTQHIHWISFVNSIVLLFLLSLIAAVVLLRVLKKDIQSNTPSLPINEYESINSWKNLVNEVTMPPKGSLYLSILVSGGIQVLVASVGVILIFVINNRFGEHTFFNNHEGSFFSFSIFCLVCSGSVSSFIGIILNKYFSSEFINIEYARKRVIVLSTLFSGTLPCIILISILFLNFFVWAKESSSALPFGSIIVLLLLLFAVEIPLGIIGGFYGNRVKFSSKSFISSSGGKNQLDHKKTNMHLLQTKRSRWLTNPFISIFVFGIIPFLVAFVELLFIFNSVWLEKTTFYYKYGFLFLTSIILIIVIAESSIIATYMSLAVYNNPEWQWLCFRVGSSVAWYIYGYAIYYYLFYLNVIDFVSKFLYFSYMALACVLIGTGFGSVGVFTGLIFIEKIYGAVKVD